MKTLSDFKRAMKPGTKWEGFNYNYGSTLGVRECSKSQTDSFAFRTDKGENSWCDFPKAKDIKFLEDGTVQIWGEWRDAYRLKLSYKQV